ncbi:MAG: alanine racemase [Propionibacteriaceae bacterium]
MAVINPATVTGVINPATASAVIDLAAYQRNLRTFATLVGDAKVMAVVKADGYGHGMFACARAARQAGIDWLGVATPGEALALRADEDTGRVLCWLYGIDEDLTELVAAEVDVTVSSTEQLGRVVAAAATSELRAAVHLKIDTGLSRNGATAQEWPELCSRAAEAEQAGAIDVVGIWSHLAAADQPGHPSVKHQSGRFADAVAQARTAGLAPQLLHLANSAGALVVPAARHDLVRIGIAGYGIDPGTDVADRAGVRLDPVMTLRAQLAAVRPLAAGESVSYGHTWTAAAPTTVALVPLGYADGIPRHASNLAEVYLVAERRRVPVRGRICMDQFVVDLGAETSAQVGDEVIVFGAPPPAADSQEDRERSVSPPTAQEWAQVCGAIGSEIVTRLGVRVPGVYRIEDDQQGQDRRGNR